MKATNHSDRDTDADADIDVDEWAEKREMDRIQMLRDNIDAGIDVEPEVNVGVSRVPVGRQGYLERKKQKEAEKRLSRYRPKNRQRYLDRKIAEERGRLHGRDDNEGEEDEEDLEGSLEEQHAHEDDNEEQESYVADVVTSDPQPAAPPLFVAQLVQETSFAWATATPDTGIVRLHRKWMYLGAGIFVLALIVVAGLVGALLSQDNSTPASAITAANTDSPTSTPATTLVLDPTTNATTNPTSWQPTLTPTSITTEPTLYPTTSRPSPNPTMPPSTVPPSTAVPMSQMPTRLPTIPPTTRRPTPLPTPFPTTKRPTPLPTPSPATKQPTPVPTPFPTTKRPTPVPTITPVPLQSIDPTEMNFLPLFTTQAILQDSDSAQAKAFRWLYEHPEYRTLPDWRKRQLMALASLYYSTNGDTAWNKNFKGDWMDASKNECAWEGGGRFDPDCNGGRYQEIDLLSFGYFKGTLPPEISFLTVLNDLRLHSHDLTGSIPSQIGELTALTWLELRSNELTGTIPTQLGELTALERFYMYDNQLTGPIPSELGELTALGRLYLWNNQLSGSIPSAVCEISALTSGTIDIDCELVDCTRCTDKCECQ